MSERLGRANVSITLDTYSHVLPGLQQEASRGFQELMEVESGGGCRQHGPNQMARPEGFEPSTLGSEDRCSYPLSYGRILVLCMIFK